MGCFVECSNTMCHISHIVKTRIMSIHLVRIQCKQSTAVRRHTAASFTKPSRQVWPMTTVFIVLNDLLIQEREREQNSATPRLRRLMSRTIRGNAFFGQQKPVFPFTILHHLLYFTFCTVSQFTLYCTERTARKQNVKEPRSRNIRIINPWALLAWNSSSDQSNTWLNVKPVVT